MTFFFKLIVLRLQGGFSHAPPHGVKPRLPPTRAHAILTSFMGVDDHKRHAPRSVRVFVLTISDSRSEETDTSGRSAQELIEAAGHLVAGYRIVKDEPTEVTHLIRRIADERTADVIITSGGTGITARDRTYEAVTALLDKRLDGFGELFRMLSYQEIGSAAMLSRAVAGLYQGVAVFCTPGSTAAVQLALDKLILPELGHLVFEAHR
jgi:molybdenum cofactor biosynthesis protein B